MIIRVICIFAILIVAIAYISMSINKKINAYAEYSIEQNSQRVAEQISTMISFSSQSIVEVADSVGRVIEEDNIDAIYSEIDSILSNTPFRGIEYIQADGLNLTSSGEVFDASDREYYIEGMKGNTGIWINFNPKYSKEALINFYTPIYVEGEIKGVVTGYLGGEQDINPLLDSSFFGNEVRGILCDGNGTIIATNGKLKYGDVLESFNGNSKEIEQVRKEGKRIDHYQKDNGQGVSCTYAIKDSDWVVIQLVPNSSLKAITGQFFVELVIGIVIVVILSVFIVFQLVRENKKKLENEQKYIESIDKINQTLNKEKNAIGKIHETLNSGSWELRYNDNGSVSCSFSDGFRRLFGYYNEKDFPNEIF